jgi:hypothetical protein
MAPPSLVGARNGVAYFTLVFPPGPTDTLLGAGPPVAGKTELHRDAMQDGIMSMRPAGPLPLKPGDTLRLAPGGLHLMLMGWQQPLKPDDRFPITLTFEHRAAGDGRGHRRSRSRASTGSAKKQDLAQRSQRMRGRSQSNIYSRSSASSAHPLRPPR